MVRRLPEVAMLHQLNHFTWYSQAYYNVSDSLTLGVRDQHFQKILRVLTVIFQSFYRYTALVALFVNYDKLIYDDI